jgi:putative aldouronate transport system substrate-binding protein
MKKLIPLLLSLTLVVPAFAAGGRDSQSRTSTGGAALTGNKKLSVIALPASAPFPAGKSITSNEIYDLLVQKTGYTIDWQLYKAGVDTTEQVNLLMASGNPPDAVCNIPTSLYIRYAKEGGLAPLDDALAKFGTYLSTDKYLTKEQFESIKIDGKIYGLPNKIPSIGYGALAVRKDWLRELNLNEPKTLEELYNVLKAVKQAKPGVIPLAVDGTLERMAVILGSFGIRSNRSAAFLIENGKASFPYLDNRCAEFIKYMHRLYAEGLIDREFVVEKETVGKFVAGLGFMMDTNYVEITRQMSPFKEKNPNGIWEYIEYPKGPNGESGILKDYDLALNYCWTVPAVHSDRAGDVIDLLDRINRDVDILDLFACGIVGRDTAKNADGSYTRLENFSNIAGIKGYYSRMDIGTYFDEVNNKLEGFDKPLSFINQNALSNEIYNAPLEVPADAALIGNIQTIIVDDIINMIVEGYSDAAFNKMKQDFANAGGNRILEQYQAWYDKR